MKSLLIDIILKTLRFLFIMLGSIFLIMLLLALTSLPFWARYQLGASKAHVPANTKTIVMMGGGGFPSKSVLMRLWFTAELAREHLNAKLVIATPGDTLDINSTVCKSRKYLIDAGIDSLRILVEPEGLNSRHQALKLYEMLEANTIEEPVVVVTSTEHVYRAVKCFERVGFDKVSGLPASEAMLETDLAFDDDNNLGGKDKVPDVGTSIVLRYKFWDYLEYEIKVAREYIAIAYYKLKGWI